MITIGLYRKSNRPPLGTRVRSSMLALLACSGYAGSSYAQDVNYDALEAIFGEPVTLSANGTPQRQQDVALAMDIITNREIKASAATTLPELLRRTAGIDFRQSSTSQQDVTARGYGGAFTPRMMVLLNGRPVYIGFLGGVVWETLPVALSSIRQIEIVRGPSSAQFGFNAFAGAINIVTYDGQSEARASGMLRYSNEGDLRLETAVSGNLTEATTGHMSVRLSDLQPFEGDSAFLDDVDQITNFALAGGIRSEITDKLVISADGSLSVGEFQGFGRNLVTFNPETELYSGRVRASYRTEYGELFVDYFLNRNSFDISGFNLGDEPSGGLDPSGDDVMIGANFAETFQNISAGIFITSFESLTLKGQVEYRNIDVDLGVAADTPSPNSDITLDNIAVSGLVDWKFAQDWRLSLSLRLDAQDVAGTPFTSDALDESLTSLADSRFTALSYNASLLWKQTPLRTVRASWGRSARVPSAAELGLFADINDQQFLIAGDPGFQTARLDQIELGYEQRFESFDGSFNLSVFYQNSRELGALFGSLPTFIGADQIPALFSTNVLDSDAFGLEAEFQVRLTDAIRVGANYSFIDVFDHNERDTFTPVTGAFAGVDLQAYPTQFEEQTPNHIANLWVEGGWNDWQATGEAHFISARQQSSAFRLFRPFELSPVSAQLLLSAKVSYDITDTARFTVTGTNLGSDRQFLNGQALPFVERRFWFGLEVEF